MMQRKKQTVLILTMLMVAVLATVAMLGLLVDGAAADGDISRATFAISRASPVAVDDNTPILTYAMPITIAVLANDYDLDGDVISVTQVTTPSSGTAVISGTTHVVYSPTVNSEGTITFTYTISDGESTSSGLVIVTIYPCSFGQPLYVDQGATGTNSGSSWDNAFVDLRPALVHNGRCGGGYDVWVATGIYKPGTTVTNVFTLTNGLALYGGFAGGETALDARNLMANPTVLSGDIGGDDNANVNGVISDTSDINGDNSHHVVGAYGVVQTAVIDGFYITGGQANGDSFLFEVGGGMAVASARVVISNTIFIGNEAAEWGGGLEIYEGSHATIYNSYFINNYAAAGAGLDIYDSSGQTTLFNNQFINNDAIYAGGGVFIHPGANPRFSNTLFDGNRAGIDGGGVLIFQGAPVFTDVTFINNSIFGGGNEGGGMAVNPNSWVELTNGYFYTNTAAKDGGGLAVQRDGHARLNNVLFQGNIANRDGGGIENYGWLTLTNGIFADNQAIGRGGGLRTANNGSTVLISTTFNSNRADDGGGVYLYEDTTTVFTDTVVYNNHAFDDGGGIYVDVDATAVLVNADIRGNEADDDGGGFSIDVGAEVNVTNGLLSGNVAAEDGGGIENYGTTTLINSTVVGNSTLSSLADEGGGGIYSYGTTRLYNSVVWNNKDVTGVGTTNSSLFDDSSLFESEYSVVQGWTLTGTGDLDGNDSNNDPAFILPISPTDVVTTAGDYRLQESSPIINVGSNGYCPASDLLGVFRPQLVQCDMGAYERVIVTLTLTLPTTDRVALDWNIAANNVYDVRRSLAPYASYGTLAAGVTFPTYDDVVGDNTAVNYFYQIYDPQGAYTSNTVGVFHFDLEVGP